MQQQRGADIVGQVGDDAGRAAVKIRAWVCFQRVALDDRQTPFIARDKSIKRFDAAPVALDGDDPLDRKSVV